MPARPLSEEEEANLRLMKAAVGDYALLFPTANGLDKSTFDATQPIRTLFESRGIHAFGAQKQAEENKVYVQGINIDDIRETATQVSCYRPTTKQGDPRIWPSLFKRHASGGDAIALFAEKGTLYLYNLTRSHAQAELAYGRQTYAAHFFAQRIESSNFVSNKLLALIHGISEKGLLRAVCKGDTAIGRSIETALGIKMNAKKTPDYDGIEIKSYRSSKPESGLMTLFSKTPDWKRGLIQGSPGFLKEFGYFNEEKQRTQLYCSVFAKAKNSLGFKLVLNKEKQDLEEYNLDRTAEMLAVWSMETLHKAFREKHGETFWIKAKTIIDASGHEWFDLQSIIHTKDAIIPQFDAFLLSGDLCMDHTIFQKGTGAKDHGYLFRVRQEKLPQLFTGEPRQYALK